MIVRKHRTAPGGFSTPRLVPEKYKIIQASVTHISLFSFFLFTPKRLLHIIQSRFLSLRLPTRCDKSPLSQENPPQLVKIQSQDINDIHPTQNSPLPAQLLLDLDFCTALNSISSSSSTTANISGQDFPVFTTDSQSSWLPQQSSALPAPSEHNPQLSPDNPHQDFVLFDNPPQNPNRSASSLSNQRRHSYNNRLERSAASHAVQNQRVAQILQSIGHPSYSVNGNRNNNNNTQFYASSAPSSSVALNQQSRSARPPVPLFNQSAGNVHQSAEMMNAAGSYPHTLSSPESSNSPSPTDVDLDDLPIFDGGASTAFSSPAVRTSFDFNGSMSSSASNLGTVSPQDLLIQEPFMSAPNSAALTALTSPSVYNESPEFGDGYDVSPNFGSADFDGSGDPWYPLFPQETSSAPEQTNLEDSPAQRSDDIDSVGNGSGTSRKKSNGSPTSGGRHSSVSGVNARKRDKPLPPIMVDDPNDTVAMKRARNTLAARKSRERKAQRLEDLEEKIAKLEQERDHWKKIALSQSSR